MISSNQSDATCVRVCVCCCCCCWCVGSHVRLHLAVRLTWLFPFCLTTAAPVFVSRNASIPNSTIPVLPLLCGSHGGMSGGAQCWITTAASWALSPEDSTLRTARGQA